MTLIEKTTCKSNFGDHYGLNNMWLLRISPHFNSYFVGNVMVLILNISKGNSYFFNDFVCKLAFFWYEWARLKREWNERFKGPWVPRKVQFTQERIEYNIFLFDDPFKGSKSLKIFIINLTFRFDMSHLSKSVHIGENSQILTVSNKKPIYLRRI
jgi:hypothetical protein